MMTLNRRLILKASPSLALAGCSTPAVRPTSASVRIYGAGAGSVFLPYAQGVARLLTAAGLPATALESKGSIENLQRVDTEATSLGTAFLGTAFEALTGSAAWTQGTKLNRFRALTPMYATSFQFVALRSSGLQSLPALASKRVGVGPAGGPAEGYFNGLASAHGISVQVVTGTPAALAADLLAGKIDALWQGAAVPIPAIEQIANASDALVFGMSVAEQSRMLERFPFLSATEVPAGTYRGQSQTLKSVAAWNFVVANQALPDADAYWITQTILSLADPRIIHSSASSTRIDQAKQNRVVPFHPGALAYYGKQGVSGLIGG